MGFVREAWTDERLDDLSHRVDEGFRDVRAELRAEIGSVRSEIDSFRAETVAFRSEVNARLDGLQRTMLYCFVSLSTATLAGMLAIATQL